MLHFQGVPRDKFADCIWPSFAPSRCKIFIWLLNREHLRTRAFLFRRGWKDSDSCPHCSLSKDTLHLFLTNSKVEPVWVRVGLQAEDLPHVQTS
uniref:Reverse transcriptase zinc-binding domain-containing protein n=1 Tax=Arundo donax TaxID=35708 RepID=A0A0A8YNM7_ARUDO